MTAPEPVPGTVLACPECGSTENLHTSEQLIGEAGVVEAVIAEDGSVHFDHDGETEVDWDSSTTVGVGCCACGWGGPPEHLVPAVDDEEDSDA